MRKRPNKNGIESIFELPNKCDICRMNFTPGEICIVEPDKRMCECLECAGDESREDILGEWIRHTYSIKPECNIFYNIDNEQAFEQMIGEKIQK